MISLRSQITVKLLGYFFLHEKEAFYINELARHLQVDRGNLIKKLRDLEGAGLFKSEFRGNQRYYLLDDRCPLYNEYKSIVKKTVGLEAELTTILKKVTGIKNAWLFGSYAKNTMDAASDIDLLVVGEHPTLLLYQQLSPIQKSLGRQINVVNLDLHEFEKRKKAKDPFLKEVFDGPRIQLL